MREAVIDDLILPDLFAPSNNYMQESHPQFQLMSSNGVNMQNQVDYKRAITQADFRTRNPIIFVLLMEHLYLFLPCTENYLKSSWRAHGNKFILDASQAKNVNLTNMM